MRSEFGYVLKVIVFSNYGMRQASDAVRVWTLVKSNYREDVFNNFL